MGLACGLVWCAELGWRVLESRPLDVKTLAWAAVSMAGFLGTCGWLHIGERLGVSGELVWGLRFPADKTCGWVLNGQALRVRPHIAIDWGDRIWLKLDVPGRSSCWVWAKRHDDPAQWLCLRRALRHGHQSRINPGV